MERKKKKTPKDYKYRQYAFRVPERKEQLFDDCLSNIEELEDFYNLERKDDELAIRRADIIIEALSIGLHKIKQKEKIR